MIILFIVFFLAMLFIVTVTLLGWPPGVAIHPSIALMLLPSPKWFMRRKKYERH